MSGGRTIDHPLRDACTGLIVKFRFVPTARLLLLLCVSAVSRKLSASSGKRPCCVGAGMANGGK
jgi:hypothetical protein